MEPATPNSTATEHADDDNTRPHGSDATERATTHTHDDWHNHVPHATTLVTQPHSTCHLCKGPANVEAWLENAGTIEICGTTFFMHIDMFNQTYEHSVQVCHNCFEETPGTTQEELNLYASLA